jgi:ribokinase
MKRYCVAGSLNMDMVTRVERFPDPGETIRGLSFTIFPGGKGANQAVALAKLGVHVEMIGALGDDVLGHRYREVLSSSRVASKGVADIHGSSTGTASIEVAANGENHIVIVPGANATVTPDYIEAQRELIEGCNYLLLQLEIPLESVTHAAAIAKAADIPVILDPAPAQELPAELHSMVSILTPNETEARLLTGEDTGTDEGIQRAGRSLLAKGVGRVVIKAGARGAFLIEPDAFIHVPGFTVNVVDTVAAGDSFNAGLAVALGMGMTMPEAIRFANATGALSTTREGAQSAMPSLEEVLNLMG